MADDERWRIEVYRDKLKRSLAARFFLRFHVSLILFATLLAGFIVDVALLHAGLKSMLVRYPLAILAAYATFVCGIKLWLDYSGIAEYVDRNKAEKLVGESVPIGEPIKARSGGWIDGLNFIPIDGDGCLVVIGIVVAGAAIFFALGGYALMAADSIFADVVLEILLAAGLLRGVRRMQRGGWLPSLWSNTWPSLAFTLCVALLLGWYARNVPEATTLPDLIAHFFHFTGKR
jgi:hypothetical protein